jgi:hypothetical protein
MHRPFNGIGSPVLPGANTTELMFKPTLQISEHVPFKGLGMAK